MFQPLYSFPGKTGTEVAAIYNGARAKGLHKLADAVLFGYANNAPSEAHFGEFFNNIDAADAFTRLGFGGGAASALDYHEAVAS